MYLRSRVENWELVVSTPLGEWDRGVTVKMGWTRVRSRFFRHVAPLPFLPCLQRKRSPHSKEVIRYKSYPSNADGLLCLVGDASVGTKRRFHRVEGAADKFRFQSFVLVTCVVPGSHHALRRLLDAESRPNSRQCQTRCPMAPRLANQIYRKTALSVQRQAGCPHRQPRE